MGVTMALPWLESLPAWADDSASRQPGAEPPVRMAVLFSGNGFHSKEWWAKGEGRAMELGKVLEPLDPLKEKLLLVRGLYNAEAGKGGDPQRANRQPAHRRTAGRERRRPIGNQHGSGRRPAAGRIDQGAQPGLGLRAVDLGARTKAIR